MASFDWQTPLSTTLGIISASTVYLITGLYWLVSWIVLNVVANAPRYTYRAVSLFATPLIYPLHYLWSVVAFFLSPFWALGRMSVALSAWALDLAVRYKVSSQRVCKVT